MKKEEEAVQEEEADQESNNDSKKETSEDDCETGTNTEIDGKNAEIQQLSNYVNIIRGVNTCTRCNFLYFLSMKP